MVREPVTKFETLRVKAYRASDAAFRSASV